MEHIQKPADHDMEFVGGALCLDFTNTLGGSRDHPTHDHLGSYSDLVSFARDAGAIPLAQARRLLVEAQRHPQIAMQMYRRGLALREAVSRAFGEVAAGRAPSDADVQFLGDETADAHAHARVTRAGAGFDWTWADDDPSLARPLWMIARSATDLLTDEADLARIRECASDTCTWLFVDRSRNHSRRWCDMKDCGNRAKQRRFYERSAQGTRSRSRAR